jgi:hypothetical protein
MTTFDPETAFTAWVCEDCYLTHHGYDAHELGHDFDPETDGPLSLLEAGTLVTDGMLARDHECEDRWIGHRSLIGCGEETRDFDTAPCDGCASRLAGTRHALTFWRTK